MIHSILATKIQNPNWPFLGAIIAVPFRIHMRCKLLTHIIFQFSPSSLLVKSWGIPTLSHTMFTLIPRVRNRITNAKRRNQSCEHYSDVTISDRAPQTTGVSMIWPTICLGPYQRKHQSSASLVLARGIHRWQVDSPHKEPVTWNMFPLDDVIMNISRGLADSLSGVIAIMHM